MWMWMDVQEYVLQRVQDVSGPNQEIVQHLTPN